MKKYEQPLVEVFDTVAAIMTGVNTGLDTGVGVSGELDLFTEE